MKTHWKRLLLGGAAITTTALIAFWRESVSEFQSGEPLGTLNRLRKQIKPWDMYWDSSALTAQAPKDVQDGISHSPTTVHRKVIIFVRHGQYELKAPSKEQKVLTDLGWRQAYTTGLYLRNLGIRIDRIIHSNLIRARQTTAALLVGLSGEVGDELFDEHTLVNLSAPYHAELNGVYSTAASALSADDVVPCATTDSCAVNEPYQPYPSAPYDCQESCYLAEGPPPVAPQPPGASSTSDEVRSVEGRRLEAGFRFHVNRSRLKDPDCAQDETILFVGHANVFRYWLCRALQLPPEAWLRIQLYHGSVSCLVLLYSPNPRGGCIVTTTRIGEVGHMPKELLSR